jgi:hypothetical protein
MAFCGQSVAHWPQLMQFSAIQTSSEGTALEENRGADPRTVVQGVVLDVPDHRGGLFGGCGIRQA